MLFTLTQQLCLGIYLDEIIILSHLTGVHQQRKVQLRVS